MEGRELRDLGKKLIAEVGRLADANEEIVKLATEQKQEIDTVQPGPPYCPTCGTFNPSIRNEGGGGPMADFILVAQCGGCSNTFYAVPEGWHVTNNRDEAVGLATKGGAE